MKSCRLDDISKTAFHNKFPYLCRLNYYNFVQHKERNSGKENLFYRRHSPRANSKTFYLQGANGIE